MERKMRIIVADCETTGLVEPIHICEVGWCEITEDLGVVSEFSSLVNPGVPIPCEVSGIHNIRTADVVDAPTIDQIKFPEGEIMLVAHNAKYDYPLLAPHMNIVTTCCTYVLARRLLPDAPEHKLATLSCYCDLEQQLSHRVLGDVRNCLGLLDYMAEGTGWDIWKLAEYSNTPVRLKLMPFGKHKGLPMEQLPKNYVEWAAANLKMDVDMAYTFKEIWGIEV